MRNNSRSHSRLKFFATPSDRSMQKFYSEPLSLLKLLKPEACPMLHKATERIRSSSLPSKSKNNERNREKEESQGLNQSVYSSGEEINYFSFETRGKEAPMSVKITKLQGEVIIYYSQITERPNSHVCDKVFTKTSFKIFGTGLKQRFLTSKKAYFGVKSLGPGSYNFSVCFGVNFADSSEISVKKIEEDSLDRKMQKAKQHLDRRTNRNMTSLKPASSSRYLPLMFSKLNFNF